MSAVEARAYAKINLCLEVLGRRPDGYHELATVFQTVSLHDEVRVEIREERGIRIDVQGADVPPGRDNLAWRAAKAYRQMRGWPEGASIRLTKRIPVGAGLGGGSADAAAVLKVLYEVDQDERTDPDFDRLAGDLGADVPFCLMGGTAIGYGRGDDLIYLPDLPPCWIALVKPELSVATAEAYGMLEPRDFTDGVSADSMADAIEEGADIEEIARHVHNAFARPLTERWPVFGELQARLRDAGALAAEITGSGSAVFGLFTAESQAESVVADLATDGLWACVVEPVSAWDDAVTRVE